MKKYPFLFSVCFLFSVLYLHTASAQQNISLVGQLSYSQGVNDIWGYEGDNAIEYALVGTQTGVSIVSLQNPTSPEELFFIPGPNVLWRDLKVWDKYAYVTNEDSGGLLIIDMSDLPLSIETYSWDGSEDPQSPIQFNSAHNMFVDEKGYGYIIGADVGEGGAIIIDLNTNPTNPNFAGIYNDRYVHDLFVRGDTMWTGEIFAGIFSVVDVSNKTMIQGMANNVSPGNFTHNVWLSDDGKTLFTTDEISDGYIGAYDVSDLEDIKELDRIQSSPGENVVPHNTFYHNGFLVTSYYRDGVVIHDATHPDNLIEVGHYDTSPLSGDGFNGCWGVYPYGNSGLILASDMEEGLFVLQPNYVQACYLEGTAIDAASGEVIPDVTVTITSTAVNTETDFMGGYKTGIADAGLYTVTFTKFGWNPVSYDIFLINGEITILDAMMELGEAFSFGGLVVNADDFTPIVGATVTINHPEVSWEIETDEFGSFEIPTFFADSYDIVAGKWGFITNGFNNQLIIDDGFGYVIELEKGYYDDFALDFGWETSGDASSGHWEAGEPDGTTFGGGNQMNPDFDITNDFGDQAFVTGNDGGNAGNDDVDDGVVRLTSPEFDLSDYGDPYLSYYRWFNTGGGQGGDPLDDNMFVFIENGITTATIEIITPDDPYLGEWHFSEFRISDFIEPTATMRVTYETSDQAATGHLVEAGLDVFMVEDALSTAVETIEMNSTVRVYPNPFTDQVTIELQNSEFAQHHSLSLKIFDMLGRVIHQSAFDTPQLQVTSNGWAAGMYHYSVENSKGVSIAVGKLVLQD